MLFASAGSNENAAIRKQTSGEREARFGDGRSDSNFCSSGRHWTQHEAANDRGGEESSPSEEGKSRLGFKEMRSLAMLAGAWSSDGDVCCCCCRARKETVRHVRLLISGRFVRARWSKACTLELREPELPAWSALLYGFASHYAILLRQEREQGLSACLTDAFAWIDLPARAVGCRSAGPEEAPLQQER